MRAELRPYAWWAIGMFILVVAQAIAVPLIEILGTRPMITLIGIAFIGMYYGATPAMLYGFVSGLLVDLYIAEVVGVSSLALVAGAFFCGWFNDEELRARLIRAPRAVLIIAAAALLSSMVYVFAYFQSLDFSIGTVLLQHVLGTTLYTALLGSIPVLILARTGTRLKV